MTNNDLQITTQKTKEQHERHKKKKKKRDEFSCTGSVKSFCSTSGIHRVKILMASHERENLENITHLHV